MNRVVTVAGYVLIMVLAFGLELAARLSRRVPTFGEALTAGLRRQPFRVLLQAAWLWLGWHLFVRAEWR